MKTKTFLLIGLFLGMGLIQISGQFVIPPPPDNKTQTGSIPVTMPYEYWIPIFLEDGSYLDDLVGPGTLHMVFKYHKGKLITMDYTWKSDELRFVNGTSDEVFKVMDVGKQVAFTNDALTGFSVFRVNIIGNQGTRYKVDGTLDWETFTYTWENIIWK